MKKRLRLKPSEATALGFEVKNSTENNNNPKYYLTDQQLQELNRIRYSGILEACKGKEIDPSTSPLMWLKSKDASIMVKNPLYVQENIQEIKDIVENSIESVLERFKNTNYSFERKVLKGNDKALKVTLSDDHVGLEPNPNDNSLFQYEYNAEIYSNSYQKVYESILKEYRTHGHFDLLLIDNLGDEQDGWNAQTTRGGHILQQNMSNAEVFETCVDVKVKLIKTLIEDKIANKIILRKCINDNHSGSFGHTVNIAVKKLINTLFSSEVIEVETLSKFIEHRTYGDHCFILTHGKDDTYMKRGLPLHLNDKVITYINDYIRFYNINSKYIHVEKGDLHQLGFQKCNSFDYRNFMSFAPPSAWIQHNFGDAYSGFSIQVVPKYSNEISHTDYFLNYKKK